MGTLVLRLHSLAAGGEAVARTIDGKVVFVDGGVPGDEVEVEVTEDKSKFARGRVRSVISPGPDRVTPPCLHADRCGGCPWQMVSDGAQRAAKEDIVARALQRVTKVLPLVVAPASLGYRQRATMYADGERIGFYGRRSHELVTIDRCLALDPRLDEALARARADVSTRLRRDDALRGTVVPSGEVQLAIEIAGRPASPLGDVAIRWVERGVAAGVLLRGSDGATAVGRTLLDDGEPGRPHLVSAAGFRQANHAQNQTLRHLVAGALDVEGQALLELYAGDGNFTRDAVGRAARVVAVEEDRDAIARLRQSLPSVEAVAARAEHELERRVGEPFTRVLLDPPRSGAKALLPSLLRLRPQRIVYVSCDPATLARDLRVLVEGDYAVEWATPVDMMPHTDHVEVVVKLTRVQGRAA